MRSATGFLDFRTDHTSVVDDVAKPSPQNGFRGKFNVSEGEVSAADWRDSTTLSSEREK